MTSASASAEFLSVCMCLCLPYMYLDRWMIGRCRSLNFCLVRFGAPPNLIVQYRKWQKAPLVSQRFILFIGSFSPERSIILILMIADQLLECVDLIWCTAGSWLTAPWYACVHQLGSIISWFIWLPGIYTHNHLSLSLDRDCNRHDSTAAGGGVPPWRLHNVPPMVGKKDGIQLLYIHKHLRLAFYERLVIHFMAWHGMAWHWTTTTTTIRDSSGAKTHGRTVRVWFCYGR